MLSQVPKCEAPGAPNVSATVFRPRHLGHPPLLNEMIRQDVRPAELAKRMNTSKQEVNRLTTLSHATKVDRIAEALHALGKELIIKVA